MKEGASTSTATPRAHTLELYTNTLAFVELDYNLALQSSEARLKVDWPK